MSDNFDSEEPYGELMERLSRGISTWNFNFGDHETLPQPESPTGGEISNYNVIISTLPKSRIIPLLSVLAVVLLALVAVVKGTLWQDLKGKFGGEAMVNLKQPDQPIRMAKVEPLITNGTIEVPISTVEEKKLVSFEYPGNESQIPLLAFRNSSGKIEAAVGLSWPCNSRRFHIEGGEIVCDVCSTRWDLETLRGVSGECFEHPLEKVTHTIKDGRLTIRKADIQAWKPPMMRG